MSFLPKKIIIYSGIALIGYSLASPYLNKNNHPATIAPQTQDEGFAIKITKPDQPNHQPGFVENKVSELLTPVITKELEKQIPEQYKKNPDPNKIDSFITVKDIANIKGDQAFCGDEISADYELRLSEDLNSPTIEAKQDVRLKIGNYKFMQGLENGLVGMAIGGTRNIKVPAKMVYDDPNFSSAIAPKDADIFIKAHLKNGDLYSKNYGDVQIYSQKEGGGRYVICSDRLAINMIAKKTDGTVLFNNGGIPIILQLGNREILYGIEKALFGMKEGGKTTVILMPNQLVNPGKAITFKLPLKEAVIFDLEIVLIYRDGGSGRS